MNEIKIGVKFDNNDKEYSFLCYDEVGVGDLVVVDTQYGFKVVTVTSINPDIKIKAPMGDIKDVVCKVDTKAFYERKEKAERAKNLKKEMDKKVKELQTIAIYEMLAEKDPALSDMLREYKNITG